ncbi:MAG: hypothetical protein IT342_02250 [Candidatus Melainabacteria bacterium]|nr:hypothetical protein [Candidatus Melainabacteria bacterium]
MTEIANIGCIKRLQLPDGWTATRQVLAQFGNSYLYHYGRTDTLDIQLSIFYRGMLVSSLSGKAFERILKKEPHELSAETVLSISEVLGNCAQPDLYELDRARTITLADKKVIDVEGRFEEFPLENRTIFINGGNDGCAVLEIIYSGPKDLFSKHAAAIDHSLKTIEWK